MPFVPHQPKRSQPLLIWLIVAGVGGVLATAPAGAMAAATLMGFGTDRSVPAQIFFWAVLTLPIAILVSPLLAWIAYGLRQPRLALGLSLAPLLWAAVIGLSVLGSGPP